MVDYHKKQNVFRRLSPSVVIVKAYAPGLVFVEEVFVKEGQDVKKNQQLLKLKYRKTLSSGQDVHYSLQQQISHQLNLLSEQEKNLIKVSMLKN
ncbi:MAG: hypothetical protein ISP86_04360 [Shewanellaceae bacterium]|nr:hypothetical protein [Shewanellaceae bacterium]